MLSEQVLRGALERIGADAPVRFDEVTVSTNATAFAMAQGGAPEWTLVAAAHQTGGRGRAGRTWVDEPGRALMFSIVLRPELLLEHAGLIALLAGSSLARACRDAAGADAACKWPNDLLVGEAKAGGILAESKVSGGALEHVVLGIGVNLGRPPAGIAGAGAVPGVQPERLLTAFLDAFRSSYQPAHPAFPGAVVAAYRQECRTLGRNVRATITDGTHIDGRAIDLDAGGGLVIETSAGRTTVTVADIRHLDG